jgi:hypothetical protein
MIMKQRRFVTLAAVVCGMIVLAGGVVARLAVLVTASIENAGALPIEELRAPALPVSAVLAVAPPATAIGNAAVVSDVAARATASVTEIETSAASLTATTAKSVTDIATEPAAVSQEEKPIVIAALPASSPTETSPASATETATEPAAVSQEEKPIVAAALPTSSPPETSAVSATATATEPTAVAQEEKPIVVAALPDFPLPPEPPTVQVATANTADPMPNDVKAAVSPIELPDTCLVAESCVDQYLWALYQRTPKEDSIKVPERRQVTVKRKGRTVTVTRTFTKLVDEDFGWKDPKAAEKAGMPMLDYVIGGMDRSFRLKLFHTLRAAEAAGLSPGITSAFRDNYRQSIASGLKAATERSYHGGSFRGGYGHGLAADIVSTKGANRAERWTSTEGLWKWIDAHGSEFGIGRPYLGRDPPHVAPIDGTEYTSRRGTKVQVAQSDVKKRSRLAARDNRSAAKALKKPRMAALQRS